MNINHLSPYIRKAWDAVMPGPWQVNERVLFDFELLYIKEGTARITVEDDVYHAVPGDIFLFRPKQRHSIFTDEKTTIRQPHIHFDLFYQSNSPNVRVSFMNLQNISPKDFALFREDMDDEYGYALPAKLSVRNLDFFEKMLFSIIKEYDLKTPYFETKMKGLFTNLWVYLLREHYWSINYMNYRSLELITQIRSYIDMNISQKLSLDELSIEFGISKYYLIKLFNKTFGMTPIKYHRTSRIERAKELLQYSNFSITQITEMTGFSSLYDFSRAFHTTEGVAPSDYRRLKMG